MNKPATLNLIFNGIGALIGLTVVLYVVYTALHTQMEPPCSERYPAPMRFALQQRDGTLLSPIELQARVGLREWGVIENTAIVPVSGGPASAALEVKLASLAEAEPDSTRPQNGVYFRWTPSGLEKAHSVCLTYSVWLPEGFAFNDGGILPGIFGGLPAAMADREGDQTRLGSRIAWQAHGETGLDVASSGSRYRSVKLHAFSLSPGRWMRIEQEVALNTLGKTDGLARMWVDGDLKAEDAKLALRTDANAKFSGVLADVGYLRAPSKVSTLRLSPFELAWR